MSDDRGLPPGKIVEMPWGSGRLAAAAGLDLRTNPHPVDTEAWREWLTGFESHTTDPEGKEVPRHLPEVDYRPED